MESSDNLSKEVSKMLHFIINSNFESNVPQKTTNKIFLVHEINKIFYFIMRNIQLTIKLSTINQVDKTNLNYFKKYKLIVINTY